MNVESYASDENDSGRKKPANTTYSFALLLLLAEPAFDELIRTFSAIQVFFLHVFESRLPLVYIRHAPSFDID